LISASQVDRIIGMSHYRMAVSRVLWI
jgi:hypothetical protein